MPKVITLRGFYCSIFWCFWSKYLILTKSGVQTKYRLQVFFSQTRFKRKDLDRPFLFVITGLISVPKWPIWLKKSVRYNRVLLYFFVVGEKMSHNTLANQLTLSHIPFPNGDENLVNLIQKIWQYRSDDFNKKSCVFFVANLKEFTISRFHRFENSMMKWKSHVTLVWTIKPKGG